MISCLGSRKDDSMVFICANWCMTCWSIERWETTLGLAIEGCSVVSDCMLIFILSVLVEPLEMLCVEAADALVPWAGDLKAEDLLISLASDMCLQEVQFVLNPVLLLCNFLESLTRLGLGQFSSPLEFESSLAHFDRQVATAGKPLLQAFLPGLVLKELTGLVIIYNRLLIGVC